MVEKGQRMPCGRTSKIFHCDKGILCSGTQYVVVYIYRYN